MKPAPETLPLLFVGHGNPLNAIEDNRFSRSWKAIGQELPRPNLIVCMSAHWMTEGSFVTSSLHPKIIYDFYGFPAALYHVQYPVTGNPKAAEDICSLEPQIRQDGSWGVDHGAWSVLSRMYPEADIPVVQLSIDMASKPEVQFELMRALREMRSRGVLFLGSGNIVHNLRAARQGSSAYEWALEFEQIAKNKIEEGDIGALVDYHRLGPSAALSIPTDDHYRPLINTLGLLYEGEEPSFFNEGIDLASVSMLSVLWR